ncbi:hypothetical protein KFU94_18760 [Chloroflexi bacterium TSY]|nr:hypothetical protein [Chloroflexi bacterium TSY]
MNGLESTVVSLPVLLVGSLLTLAFITYILRHFEWLTSLVATLFTSALAFWLWNVDLSEPVRNLPITSQPVNLIAPLERFGFVLQLQAGAVPILTTSLTLTAVAIFLTIRVSQGHSFVPLVLGLLAGYIFLALVISGPLAPPLITPIFLACLSSLGVFAFQAGRSSHPGPLRTLVPPVLAFPLFLLAAWYIEQTPLNPQDVSSNWTAGQLMALGIIIMLAPVPLHSAMPTTAESAPPVVTALLTLLYQLALLHLIFRVVSSFPVVTQQPFFGLWLGLAGLITAVWGGIATAGANHPGRLWGYAALHDWGLIIMILGVPGARSWPLVLFLFGLRAVSMLTAATGLSVIEQQTNGYQPEQLSGIGTRLPWNSTAYLLGGLGLTGFPLSAGFTGHWAALQIIAADSWQVATVVLIASAGAVFGFIRMARILFGPLEQSTTPRERPVSAILAVVVIVISACLALAPQLLDGPISRALLAFSS